MKYLLLFLITFTAHASYIKKDKVGKCYEGVRYSKRSKCGSDCIKIDKNYNCEYSEIEPAKYLKEQSDSCDSKETCQAKMVLLNCESDGFHKIRNSENTEVYCTKYVGEHVKDNESKKANYKANKKAKKDEEKAKKDELLLIKNKKWKNMSEKDKDSLIEYLMERIR